MKSVKFFYSAKLTFDDYVHNHSFALRVIPPETPSQKITSCALNITPFVSTQQTIDAFGNNITSGYIKGDHRFLDFEIKGSAQVDKIIAQTICRAIYINRNIRSPMII